MAYQSCAAEVAANIAQSCTAPNVGGYTGRGIYIPRSYNPDIVHAASNPRIISAITIEAGLSVVAIDNVMQTPFDGSLTELNTDSGWERWHKTLNVRIPLRGADASSDVVEPLVKSALGGIVVLEKKDTKGDGSFEVIGVEQGMRATTATRNEGEANGDWQETLETTEMYAEYTLFDTDYATTLTKFEALLAKAY